MFAAGTSDFVSVCANNDVLPINRATANANFFIVIF
jgi:hypothetical protein